MLSDEKGGQDLMDDWLQQVHKQTQTQQETTEQEGSGVTRNSSYPCWEGRKSVRVCVTWFVQPLSLQFCGAVHSSAAAPSFGNLAFVEQQFSQGTGQ